MGEDLLITAQLAKTPEYDTLALPDGQTLRLPSPLPYASGEEIVVAIMPKGHYDKSQQEVAHAILHEILNGQ